MIHALCALTVMEKGAECTVVAMRLFSENRRHLCTYNNLLALRVVNWNELVV